VLAAWATTSVFWSGLIASENKSAGQLSWGTGTGALHEIASTMQLTAKLDLWRTSQVRGISGQEERQTSEPPAAYNHRAGILIWAAAPGWTASARSGSRPIARG
jgi:hypothetical protein